MRRRGTDRGFMGGRLVCCIGLLKMKGMMRGYYFCSYFKAVINCIGDILKAVTNFVFLQDVGNEFIWIFLNKIN